jgi:hypothetical protein
LTAATRAVSNFKNVLKVVSSANPSLLQKKIMAADTSFIILLIVFAAAVLTIGSIFAYLFVYQTNESLLIRYGLALDQGYGDTYKFPDLEKPSGAVLKERKSSFLMDAKFKRIDHMGSII